MASILTIQKLRAMLKIVSQKLTLVGTTISSWSVDMRDFEWVSWNVLYNSGTAITQLEVIASESSDMSSAVVIKTYDLGSNDLNGAGDQANIEVWGQELLQQSADDTPDATPYTNKKNYRYVAVRITGTATDQAFVCMTGRPRHLKDGITPTFTATVTQPITIENPTPA